MSGAGAGTELVPRLRSLVDRAQGGDVAAVAELRVLASGSGEAAVVVAGMLRGALDLWSARRAGGDPLKRLAVDLFVDELRRDLAGESPSPLELLMVERVVVTWLALEVAELEYLDRTGRDHSRVEARVGLDRVSGSQARFLASVRGLATARKMKAPEILSRMPRRRGGSELVG